MKVFVIAGVGDNTGYIRKKTRDWDKKYGLKPTALEFGWDGDYAKNYARLKNTIVKLSSGETVAVIGISAGGSAAIRLASELPNISKVVTICARASRGGFMTLKLKAFPAYWTSVDALKSIDCTKEILIVKPLFDEIVAVKHMDYNNMPVLRTPHLLHIPSVLRILSKQADAITDFINRKPARNL